jgi:hypothetical protein
MASNNQIFYFIIGDYYNKSELGHYICEDNCISEDDKNYIMAHAKSLYLDFGEKDIGSKEYKILENNQYAIFYSITSSGTFYLAVTSIHSVYLDQNNLIFELFEDIEHQGIKKLVDKNGNLTRVGNQNLKFSIEQNNNKMKEHNIDEGDNKDSSKIVTLNNQINDINNDVKNSVKNMIVSVNEMKYLDNKSSELKEFSDKFQQGSYDIERKMRNRNLLIKIGFGIIGVIGIYIAFRFIFY